MIGIEKIELALEAAKVIATNGGKTVQEWDYEVTSGQQTVYSFMNAEEKHMLRITPEESSILLGRVVPHHEDAIDAIIILCDAKDIMELLVTFFVVPEETYEALLDMKGVMRISSSR